MLGFKENFIGKNFARHHFVAVNAVSNILRRLFSEIRDSFKKISTPPRTSPALDPLPDTHPHTPPPSAPQGLTEALTSHDRSIPVGAACDTFVLKI